MLISYEWLTSYLPKLPAPAALAEMMMLHGLDVESIDASGPTFDRVVVGEIVGLQPHPNADKLRLANVVIAPGGESQEIVCGAPNIAVGQKAPVALVGAKLPNGLTIEPRAIRGVTSNGMLCAADELGLGNDHSGILVLDPNTKVGTPLNELFQPTDTILDVTTPANRADLMSMRGLAWELGAMLGQKPKFSRPAVQETSAPSAVTVQSADTTLCPVFMVRTIRGLRSVPTPDYIVQRLSSAGMRSISLIVDCTNYIMLEYGQPLHAYDAKKITGAHLSVRPAKHGERLVTLDQRARSLTPDMLIIADGNGPVGLAGVMGGRDTEVSEETTDILLEAAIFHPVSIRKTSRQLGLVSEASKRFEKGLWPEVTTDALNAAAAMIAELGGGMVDAGVVSVSSTLKHPRTVTVTPEYIADRLGMKVTATQAKTVLHHLGFSVAGTAKKWEVTVPAWRLDVSLPEDIVDEVGRMIGYEDVPSVALQASTTVQPLPTTVRFIEEAKNVLVDLGFTEVISHAFYGEKSARRESEKGQHFEVANPLDSTQHKLRKSLRPQIFDILKKEADAGRDAKIFEVGLVFDPELPGGIEKQQRWKLALGMAHKETEGLSKVQQLFLSQVEGKNSVEVVRLTEPTRGRVTEVCEFDLHELMQGSQASFGDWDPTRHIATNVTVKALSKYPGVTRDISCWWVGEEASLLATISGLQLELLNDVQITDRFTKDGRTSYKVSCRYQSDERTLTKQEVDDVETIIKNTLVAQGGIIR